MQLRFTHEEIVLLADALEGYERRLREQVASDERAESERRRKHARVEGLLDSMSSIHLEFDADQLDDLTEVLRDCKQWEAARLATVSDTLVRSNLEQHLRTLGQILDKVTEACAMA